MHPAAVFTPELDDSTLAYILAMRTAFEFSNAIF